MSKKQSENKRALWRNPEVRERMLAGGAVRRPFQHGNRYTYQRYPRGIFWPSHMDENGNILCDEARKHKIWLDRISDL